MVFIIADCGCKFEAFGIVQERNDQYEAFSSRFRPCGGSRIASDRAEFESWYGPLNPDPIEGLLFPLNDPMLPVMPQENPTDQPGEPCNEQKGQTEEEGSRRHARAESVDDFEEQHKRYVEQRFSGLPSMYLLWHADVILTITRKWKYTPSPPPDYDAACHHLQRARRGVSTELPAAKRNAPRRGRPRYRGWEDVINEDDDWPESDVSAREGWVWSGSGWVNAAAFAKRANLSHERRRPQGGPSHEAHADEQQHRTDETLEARNFGSRMFNGPAQDDIAHQRHQPRAHRQRRSSTHHQQRGNEHRQRPEATQQPARQGQRNGNDNTTNDAKAKFRIAQQAYFLLQRHGLVPPVGREPTRAATRQEADRVARRYWAIVASKPPQRLADDIEPPVYESWVPLSENVSGIRSGRQGQVEGYLGTNARNARRSHGNNATPIKEEPEHSSDGSGGHGSSGRRYCRPSREGTLGSSRYVKRQGV